jgi:sortase (surface protein transpeptidase)
VTSVDDAEVLAPSGEARLTLVTCYPFNGLLRSPWRYIVTAVPAVPDP